MFVFTRVMDVLKPLLWRDHMGLACPNDSLYVIFSAKVVTIGDYFPYNSINVPLRGFRPKPDFYITIQQCHLRFLSKPL